MLALNVFSCVKTNLPIYFKLLALESCVVGSNRENWKQERDYEDSKMSLIKAETSGKVFDNKPNKLYDRKMPQRVVPKKLSKAISISQEIYSYAFYIKVHYMFNIYDESPNLSY